MPKINLRQPLVEEAKQWLAQHVADTLHKAKGKWKEEMNKEGGSHVNKYAASELIKDATNAATTPITLAMVLKLLLLDYPGRDILYILTQDLEEYEQFGVPITSLQAMQEQIRVVSNQIESHFGVAGDLLTYMVLRSGRVHGLQMLVNSVETKSPLDKIAAYFLETKLIMAKVSCAFIYNKTTWCWSLPQYKANRGSSRDVAINCDSYARHCHRFSRPPPWRSVD